MCERLAISEARFYQLRDHVLKDALNALEPQMPGRPRKEEANEDERIKQFEERIKRLDLELQAAHVRTQLALTMLEVLRMPQAEKKAEAVTQNGDRRMMLEQQKADLGRILALREDCANGQLPKRQSEAAARLAAVEFLAQAQLSAAEASEMLCVSEVTAREWKRRCNDEQLGPCLLGRPPIECNQFTRNAIEHILWLIGPHASVAYVMELFPEVPRSAIEQIVSNYKCDWRSGRRASLLMLGWQRAGTVWAVDWTDPPMPLEGLYDKLLVVRDLASGDILMALPAKGSSALLASDALEHLFKIHGAPLVLKSDNGSEFIAVLFEQLLELHGVTHLLSPEYFPQYNGAIEAGIGSLKSRAFYQAARNGRVDCWTCDDIEAARLQANETTRPAGPWTPSPDARWIGREIISEDERMKFKDSVETERRKRLEAVSEEELTRAERKAIERKSIAMALVKHGCLTIKRSGVSLPISHEETMDIT